MRPYLVFTPDGLIAIGTVEDCAIQLEVANKTIYFWASSSNRSNTKMKVGKWALRLDQAMELLTSSEKKEANEMSMELLGERYF